MKVATAAHDIRASGIGESQAFTLDMRDPSKLFDVLINYTNPIGAMVREYACNAFDIHQQIGQTKPFLVVAPSAAEPMFRVRDFGTGLSDEKVKTLYCSFLNSTKDSSNDLVGGFGLGSKSGFAYADMFTVTSWQSGWKSVFSVYRGPDRVPRIALAERAETDEPDGFEVAIPIKAADYSRVVSEIQSKLQWFPNTAYETVGCTVTPYRPTLSGKGWSTKAEISSTYHYYYRNRAPKVKMGPVVYDVDWKLVGDVIEIDDLIIDVPMGSVSLPFTREHVSLDDSTIALLKKRLAEVREDALETSKAQLKAAPTPWELARVAQANGPFIEIFDKSLQVMERDGFYVGVVGGSIPNPNALEKISVGRGTLRSKTRLGYTAINYSELDRVTAKWGIVEIAIRPETAVVVIDDVSPKSRKPYLWPRLRANKTFLRAALPTTCNTDPMVIIVPEGDEHLKALGSPPQGRVFRMSDLVFQPTVKGKPVDTDPIVYKYDPQRYDSQWRQKRLSEVDPDVIIPMHGTSPSLPGWSNYTSLAWVRDANLKWVGMPIRAQKELGELCPPSIDAWVKEKLNDVISQPNFNEQFLLQATKRRLHGLPHYETLMQLARQNHNDNLLSDFAAEAYVINSTAVTLRSSDISSLSALAGMQLVKLPQEPGEYRFEVLHKRLLEKRPVFRMLLANMRSTQIYEPENLPTVLRSLEIRNR